MSKEKLVPKLRFEEFRRDNTWELKSLEETVDITMGQSPSSKNYTNNPSDYILVQGNSDLKNGKVFPRIWTTQVTKKANKGDLILSVRAPVGDVGKTDFDVVLGRGVAAIAGNEFIFQLLTKMKVNNYWTNLITGSTFESINSNDIRDAKVFFPRKEEQNKIGSFLKKIDKMIDLQQSKANKVKDIKSAYLSEMFPKEGEKYPKKRFEGFSKPWDEEYLGSLSNITTGALDANAMNPTGKYDFYTSGIQKYRIDTPAFEGPAITIAGNGATVGYMHLADGSFNAYQRTYVLTQFHAVREFLYLEIGRKLPVKIRQEARMGNIPYIVMDMLADLTIHLPSREEQQKIAEFFTNLDNQISIEEEKLTKLEKLKQAYLNDMFV